MLSSVSVHFTSTLWKPFLVLETISTLILFRKLEWKWLIAIGKSKIGPLDRHINMTVALLFKKFLMVSFLKYSRKNSAHPVPPDAWLENKYLILAIQPWGMKYASHRCRHGQKEEDGFFEKIWKKHVRYFDRRLPELVGGVFRDAGRCNFKNGFEWFLEMFKTPSFNNWIFYCIQQ